MEVDKKNREVDGGGKMHRLFLTGLLVVAGCQGVVGPIQRRCLTDPIDDPRLSPDEQKARLRERSALPIDSPTVGPRTYADVPNR